jgi:transcriptional regulator with XRE-family HTH domain
LVRGSGSLSRGGPGFYLWQRACAAVTEFPDPWRELGDFIREQRSNARLSVRRLSDMAGISNPYLSQIERGLRRPSAEILQQIARALRISAETLYVRAGILEAHRTGTPLAEAIVAEASLRPEQKQTLLHIYMSFRRENGYTDDVEPATSAEPALEPPTEIKSEGANTIADPMLTLGSGTTGDASA